MPSLTKIERQYTQHANELGWGDPTDWANHRLIKERRHRVEMEDQQFFSNLDDRMMLADADTESPMEQLCRSMFQFDQGWSFHASEQLLYGEPLVHSQGSVGSCVGAGGGLAIAAKASQEILNEGDLEDPVGWSPQDGNNLRDHAMPFTGYHYGAGRCKNLWDGERFVGSISRGDGSYCSVQIWAYKTVGILPCDRVKDRFRGPFPQSSDVRSWGNNRRDELNEHLDIASEFRMSESVVVRSGQDLMNVITVLKQPCHICSGWGFASAGFDPRYEMTIYRRSGTWYHNMTIYGVFEVKGTWFVIVKNSWGAEAHREIGRGFPAGCFVIPLSLFDSWIPQAECMSIGELTLPKPSPLFG